MSIWLLGAGLAMGFLGSPHCLGMCGGIVSAFGISMQSVSTKKKPWLISAYHLGRMMSYMALGLVAALVGSTVLAPFMHSSAPRIILGLAIIFAALLMLGVPMLKNIEKLGFGLWQKLSPIRQKLFPLDSLPKALLAGLLWGLLPCGLVYGAIGVAIGLGASSELNSDNLLSAVGFMLAFGVGTLPMLLATQSVVALMQAGIKKFSLRQASGVLMLISGFFVAVPAFTHKHPHHDHHSHSQQHQSSDGAHSHPHSQDNSSDEHSHHH